MSFTPAFLKAVEYIFKFEGGLNTNTRDRGGITNLGISYRFLKSIDARATEDDVREITHMRAQNIYLAHFWAPCQCDRMPFSIALCVFDCAINQGERRAKRLIQRSVGVKDDGIIGPISMRSISHAHTPTVVDDYLARRLKKYAEHPDYSYYGRGWNNRIMDIHRIVVNNGD